jgi:hypothetical protein
VTATEALVTGLAIGVLIGSCWGRWLAFFQIRHARVIWHEVQRRRRLRHLRPGRETIRPVRDLRLPHQAGQRLQVPARTLAFPWRELVPADQPTEELPRQDGRRRVQQRGQA